MTTYETNGYYDSATCRERANGGGIYGSLVETPDSLARCRPTLYGCEGGSQSMFQTTERGGYTIAACKNHLQGDRNYDSWFCPLRPPCVSNFSYPWHPTLDSPGSVDWLPGTSNLSAESFTRKFFRLPVLDIRKLTCKPSPFVNATNAVPRTGTTIWSPMIPVSLCT